MPAETIRGRVFLAGWGKSSQNTQTLPRTRFPSRFLGQGSGAIGDRFGPRGTVALQWQALRFGKTRSDASYSSLDSVDGNLSPSVMLGRRGKTNLFSIGRDYDWLLVGSGRAVEEGRSAERLFRKRAARSRSGRYTYSAMIAIAPRSD